MAVSRFPKRPVPVQVKRTGLGCLVKGAMVAVGLVVLVQTAVWRDDARVRREAEQAKPSLDEYLAEHYPEQRELLYTQAAQEAPAAARVAAPRAAQGQAPTREQAPVAAPATKGEACEQYLALFDFYIAGNKRWKEEERTRMPHATNSDDIPQTWADRQAIGSAIVARKPAGCEL